MSYKVLPNAESDRGWSQKATLARTEELTRLGKTKGKGKVVEALLARDRAAATTLQQTSAFAQSAQASSSQADMASLIPKLLSKLQNRPGGAPSGAPGAQTNFGPGRVNKLATKMLGADNIRQWTNVVDNFFPGFEQAQSHHDETNRSRDITFLAGESAQEQKWLQLMVKAMEKAYGFSMGSSVVGGHGEHAHVEFESRRNLTPTEVILDSMGSYFNNNRN